MSVVSRAFRPWLFLGIILATFCAAGAQGPAFDNPVTFGSVTTYDIWEASGLIASRQNPGVIWTHNDSGYPGTVFALSTNGALLARWSVPNVFYGDFEDMAIGPGLSPSCDYIYLGDIGDNYFARTSIRILRFPEPAVYGYQSDSPVQQVVPRYDEITLMYPDGIYNAEGMFVDPRTGDLFIFTKLDTSSRVYRATRAELDSGNPITLTFMLEITFRKVSGADISRDGSMIVLRRGGTAELWSRGANQTVDAALAGSSRALPLAVEPNGEAIAFGANNEGYYTLSEGYLQPLYWYPRIDTTPASPRVFAGAGSSWKFDDSGFGDTPGWTTLNFDDQSWSSGLAPLGYASSERTTLYFGVDTDKITTTYLRNKFQVSNRTGLTNLILRACWNDGIAVFLNGTEIYRQNLSTNAAFDSLASGSHSDMRNIWSSIPVDPALLLAGNNVLAAEVHRADRDGLSLNFDLALIEGAVSLPARFTTLPRVIGNQCTVHIAGPAGSTARVLGSMDLVNWTEAGRVLLTNGQGDFQEPTGNPMMFLRIAH